MPSGNGNRAKQKRERNLKRDAEGSAAKSQLKTNEAAKTVMCKVCSCCVNHSLVITVALVEDVRM